MNTKDCSYLLIVMFLLMFSGVGNVLAQTKATREKVLRHTDVKKLKINAYNKSSQAQKIREEAINFAKSNNLLIRKETNDNRIIELQKLRDNGKPLYFQTFNVDAAHSISTDRLWTGGDIGLNLNGEDMIVGEWDGGGVLSSHVEFQQRVTQRDDAVSFNDHATHVAGTMIASGVNPQAKGMSPKAFLWAYDWNNDEGEMSDAALQGLLLSNHSYGSVVGWSYGSYGDEEEEAWYWFGSSSISTDEDVNFGRYDDHSANWDEIANLAPYYLIVKSAGNDRGEGPVKGTEHYVWVPVLKKWVESNTIRLKDGGEDGYDCISSKGLAKNVLTVGAVSDVNSYEGPESVVMSSFSSWGPTDDGRIKPDICGNGVGVYSSISKGVSEYSSYAGTSMAAPNITGSLVLLQQHYHNLYDEYMLAATLKALVINNADETGASPGPDYSFGWGLMNTAKAANAISSKGNSGNIIADTIHLGQYDTFVFSATGTEPLRATLVWSDPKGTPGPYIVDNPDKMLVNDLDLRVIRGEETWTPWVLDPFNPSAPATTGDNIRDNVEQVYIADPEPGEYKFVVSAKDLKHNAQSYSLVISGISSNEDDIAITRIDALVGECDYGMATPIEITIQNVGVKGKSNVRLNYSVHDENEKEVVSSSRAIPYIEVGQDVSLIAYVPFTETNMQYSFVADLSDDQYDGNNHMVRTFKTIKTDLASGDEILVQGFEEDVFARGWSFVDSNNDNIFWTTSGDGYQHSGDSFYLLFANGGVVDDWFFSNCLQMSAEETYRLKFFHSAPQSKEKFRVFIGNDNIVTSMTRELAYINSEGGWTEEVIDFTVDFDGIYYIGWHAIGLDSYALGIDDIRLQNMEVSVPEAKFLSSARSIKAGDSIDLVDVSTGNPVSWEWILDGVIESPLTEQNVNVSYHEAGVYDVVLRVENQLGNDTLIKEDYIAVSKQNIFMCDSEVDVFDGYFTDSQGDKQYLGGEDYQLTLYPGVPGKALKVKFFEFSLPFNSGSPNDWLEVYDGNSVKSNLINQYSANNVPYEIVSKNKDGALTFVFHSDESIEAQGWRAHVNVVDPFLVANFKVDNNVLIAGQAVNFTDYSSGSPTSWKWTFEGGTPSSSTNQNPTGIIYNEPGSYSVMLTVADDNGEDTRTIENAIVVDSVRFESVSGFLAELNEVRNSVVMNWLPVGVLSELKEGFEGNGLPSDWSIKYSTRKDGSDLSDSSDGNTWFQCSGDDFSGNGENYIYSGDHSAAVNWDSKDFNWLISPDVFIKEEAQLRFWMWYYNGEDGDSGVSYYTNFHVMVFHEGSWKTLKSFMQGESPNLFSSQVVLSLSDYVGEMVKVAFVYEYNDGYQLAIDDVFIGSASSENSTSLNDSVLKMRKKVCRELSNKIYNLHKIGSVKTTEQKVTGYKIYRDYQELTYIESDKVFTYTDTPDFDGNYTYFITAIYAYPAGESAHSQYFTFGVEALQARFDTIVREVFVNEELDFTDKSFGNIDSWEWIFEGGTPVRSIQQNPEAIFYNEVGEYDVTLTVADAYNSDTETIKGLIKVIDPTNEPISGFVAKLSDIGSSIEMSWELSLLIAESNRFSGVRIYRNGVEIAFIDDLNANTYVDSPGEPGTYTYAITAVYVDPESESPLSELYTVDLIYTGIGKDYSAGNINIYPNPTSDNLYIESGGTLVKKIEIYNSYGAIINSLNIAPYQQRVVLDFKDRAPGLYLLKLYSADGIVNYKVIVQ